MPHSRSTTVPVLLFLATLPAFAHAHDVAQTQNPVTVSSQTSTDQAAPPAPSTIPLSAQHISKQTRYQILRDFETQLVYARTVFPMNTKGLRLQEGMITPSGEDLHEALALWGPAIKPGDPARISFVQIKGDHIHFEINGGPTRHKKWYQRVEITGAYDTPVVGGAPDEGQANPHGSFVDLYFPKYVPEMTSQQLRALLYPVLDFSARNKEQAYLDTLPAKVKTAIQAHHVLVGMNQEMVVHAKGKPPKKVRERDGETQYEEWIYGEPPADVDFVRFVGDEVVRVETMKVGGEKIVRTQREVVLPQSDKDKEAKKEPSDRPDNAPTLRRPGEDSQDVPKPAAGTGTSPLPPLPPPDIPQPSGPPIEMMPARD